MADLTWKLRLMDLISGPARGAARSLGLVDRKLQSVDNTLRGGGSGMKAWQKAQQDAAKAAQRNAKAMGDGFTVAGGVAVNAIGAIASKMAELGAMGLAKLGDVLQGGMDKAGIMGGLSLLTGGADKAAAAYAQAAAKARELGMNTLDAAKGLQGLLSRGFQIGGDTGALKTLTALRALKTISPNVNQDAVLLALGQVQSKGKLMMEELSGQLAESLNKGFILDEIAKMKGYKTRAEVEKAITAGLIDSETGIAAIFKSIERVGGGSLEAIASKGKGSFNNMMERLMGLPGEIGQSLDFSKFFETGVRAIDRIIVALTNPKAQKFFDSIFNTMGAGLIDKAAGAFEKIAAVIMDPKSSKFFEQMSAATGEGIEGIGEGFKGVAEAMAAMDGGDPKDFAKSMRMLGQAVGATAAIIVYSGKIISMSMATSMALARAAMVGVKAAVMAVGAVIPTVGAAISRVGAIIVGAFTTVLGMAVGLGGGLGGAIIGGIVTGISAGLSAVVAAITGVAKGAIDAAKKVLEIGSPSKVFRGFGRNTSASLGLGVKDNAAKAAGASADMAARTTAAASPEMASRATEAGRFVGQSISNSTTTTSASTSVNVASLNVHGGNAEPRVVARAVANELRGMVAAHG